MSTISPSSITTLRVSEPSHALDQHGWGFLSLLLVVGSLFIRPADLLPQLRDVPVYQYLIVTAVLLSYRAIGSQLNQQQLVYRPVTTCILLLVFAVALSHIANGFFWGARDSAWMASKLAVLYLLIAGVVNTTQRLEGFACGLVLAISIMSGLALADHFGWLDLSAFAHIEDRISVDDENGSKLARICGSGIFEDPNDLGLAVVIGIALIPYFLFKPNQGWPRYVWVLPGVILVWTLALTYSRGAFLALAATVPAWFYFHRNWVYALVGSGVFLPILAILFAGRMTEFNSVYEGTGQSRIQIWSESLTVFRNAPLFGIGEGMFSEDFGIVSHNSFLQNYTELGFLGGTLFVAIFLTAIIGLLPTRNRTEEMSEQEARLRGAIFVVVIGYTLGIFTLSRQFVATTFLVLGLAVASQLTGKNTLPKSWQFGNGLAIRACLAGIVFLGLIYLIIQLLNRSV